MSLEKLWSVCFYWPQRKLNFSLKPVAISLICALALTGCRSDLYANLEEREANEIVATLLQHHISASRSARKDNLYAVVVDEANFAEAVRVLNENGLPKQNFVNLGQVFKKDGLVSSPIQERAQMVFALSQELSKTISEMDGVLSARVHIVLPENDPLRQQLMPSSASVFIRHQASVQISDLVPQIKMLVANGIAGLSYDKVSVILVPVIKSPSAEQAADDMVLFWGVWINKNSVGWASWLFYGLVGVIVLLSATIGYFVWLKTRKVYRLPTVVELKT